MMGGISSSITSQPRTGEDLSISKDIGNQIGEFYKREVEDTTGTTTPTTLSIRSSFDSESDFVSHSDQKIDPGTKVVEVSHPQQSSSGILGNEDFSKLSQENQNHLLKELKSLKIASFTERINTSKDPEDRSALATIRTSLMHSYEATPEITPLDGQAVKTIGVESGATQGGVTTGFFFINSKGEKTAAVFKASSGDIDKTNIDIFGIPGGSGQEATNLPARNVAFYRVAKLLGTEGLVPETHLASFGGKTGVIQAVASGRQFFEENLVSQKDVDNNQLAKMAIGDPEHPLSTNQHLILDSSLVLKEISDPEYRNAVFENGKPIDESRAKKLIKEGKIQLRKKEYTFSDLDLRAPSLQKELSQLEILDFLMGSADRHAGDFFFTKPEESSDNQSHVMVIDNDLCFGGIFEPDEFDDDSIKKQLSFANFLKRLPRNIDVSIEEKVLNLNLDDLKKELAGLGLESRAFEAFEKRLTYLKNYFSKTAEEGGPTFVEKWDETTYESSLPLKGEKNVSSRYLFSLEDTKNIF